MVTFEHGWVRWICHGEVWDEYGDTGGQHARIFSKPIPDTNQLDRVINAFNTRNLTFPEDALFEFSGIASAPSSIFQGGFVSGLPVLLFHIGLLWTPVLTVSRREPKGSAGDAFHHGAGQVGRAACPA